MTYRSLALPTLVATFLFVGCGQNFQPASLVNPPSVSAAGPTIIAKSFIGQTGPIPDTTLVMPTADGEYRMSIYLTAGAGTIINNIEVAPSWTDENGTTADGTFGAHLGNQSSPTLQIASSSGFFHAKAGVPIKAVGVGTDNTDFKYDAYVTLEPLQ